MATLTNAEKAEAFRALHYAPSAFVLPTAWDAASARIYENLGATAVGTTSSGIAHTFGYADGEGNLPPETLLEMVAVIVRAVSIPVSADIEAGHGDPAGLAEAVIDAGAVGLNLEDRVGAEETVRPVAERAQAVAAVREAAVRAGVPIVVNARTDTLDRGGDVADAVARGNAYLDAGADCVLVVGAKSAGVIAALVAGIRGPVNIAVRPGYPAVSELDALGVRRISVTPSGAVRSFLYGITQELLERGTYSQIEARFPYPPLNELFGRNAEDDGGPDCLRG